VKVWVFKGEVLEHDPMAMDKRLAGESGPAGEGGRDRDRDRGDRSDRGPRRERRESANA
jgi:small subunit ribosomal protein S3